MKKLLLLIICFFIANHTYGQMPVTDAAANVNIGAVNTNLATVNTNLAAANKKSASILGKAILQIKELVALKEKYTEQMNLIKEVNGYISNGEQVVLIKNLLKDIGSEYSEGLSFISEEKLIKDDEKVAFYKIYKNALNESVTNFGKVLDIISADKLSMNDAERITLLNRIEEILEDNKNYISYVTKKTKYVVSLKKKENARQANLNSQKKAILKKN